MSKAKFIAAKELIQEKKYDEARAILKTINDPKAQKWLNKIDNLNLAPSIPQEQYTPLHLRVIQSSLLLLTIHKLR